MTAPAQALLAQLLDPVNRADPYPIFRRLRECGPVSLPDSNLVVFSSFADCDEVLRHPASCSIVVDSQCALRHPPYSWARWRPLTCCHWKAARQGVLLWHIWCINTLESCARVCSPHMIVQWLGRDEL